MIEIYDESNKRVAIENQEWAFKWILSMNAFLQLKAELKAKADSERKLQEKLDSQIECPNCHHKFSL